MVFLFYEKNQCEDQHFGIYCYMYIIYMSKEFVAVTCNSESKGL